MKGSDSHQEPLLFCLSDLWALILRRRRLIIVVACLLASMGAFRALSRSVTYMVEGSFRERETQGSNLSAGLSDLLFRGANGLDSQTASLMKSRYLMRQVVEELGLQASIAEKGSGRTLLGTMVDNLKVRWAHLMRRKKPLFPDPIEAVVCRDLHYDGEYSVSLRVDFIDETHFHVFNRKKRKIGEGQLGVPYQNDKFSFVLACGDEGKPLAGRQFGMALLPLHIISESMGKSLEIEADEDDQQLLKLRLRYSDRQMGTQIVNKIMEVYQRELHAESDEKAKTQLAYLAKRQRDTVDALEVEMRRHAAYCAEGLRGSGSLDSAKEMEFLARSQAQGRERQMAIQLELRRLRQLQDAGEFALYDHYATGDAAVINSVLSQIRSLKQQRATLEHRRDSALADMPASTNQFAGIDLSTAQRLYLGYQQQLDAKQGEVRQNNFIIAQLSDPEFDISSLSTTVTDPVCAEAVRKASELQLALHDQDNRTNKERQRIRYNLDLQKRFLTAHLEQAVDVGGLREEQLREKIDDLQAISLALIDEQIAILSKHLDEFVAVRQENLRQEQELIDDHLGGIREQMAELPDQWVSEQLVQRQIDASQRVLQEVTHLVESKNLSHNLELIQSGPLDVARPPILPMAPRIFLLTVLGAMAGAFFSIAGLVVQALFTGVSASKDNAEVMGLKVAGTLPSSLGVRGDALPDSALEALRGAICHLPVVEAGRGQMLLALTGNGPDYAEELAGLMALRGSNVVCLSLAFDKPGHGLLQAIQSGEMPEITKGDLFDTIASGGVSRYGNELVASPQFEKIVEELRAKYDYIVAASPASAVSAEGLQLIQLTDATIATLNGESVQDVQRCLVGVEGVQVLFCE